MKSRRNVVVFALIAAATTLSNPSFTKDADREQAVKTAELARFKANVDADVKALGLLLADDLDYVHSGGDVDTKASFIEALASGRLDYTSVEPTIEKVRILGDIAIVRGTAKVTASNRGSSSENTIGFTDAWIFRDQRWQLTAWRSARYAAPAPQPAK